MLRCEQSEPRSTRRRCACFEAQPLRASHLSMRTVELAAREKFAVASLDRGRRRDQHRRVALHSQCGSNAPTIVVGGSIHGAGGRLWTLHLASPAAMTAGL